MIATGYLIGRLMWAEVGGDVASVEAQLEEYSGNREYPVTQVVVQVEDWDWSVRVTRSVTSHRYGNRRQMILSTNL